MVFDLLHLDGRSTRALPYSKRRLLLDELRLDGPLCRTPESFVGQTRELFAATAQHGLEGVVVKRLSSSYESGRRSGAWLKHKHRRREAFVVTGWLPGGEREPDRVSSGSRTESGLQPAGRVSYGIGPAERDALRTALVNRELPRQGRRSGVRWGAPTVTVEVDFHGPSGGLVRDPVLRGIAAV